MSITTAIDDLIERQITNYRVRRHARAVRIVTAGTTRHNVSKNLFPGLFDPSHHPLNYAALHPKIAEAVKPYLADIDTLKRLGAQHSTAVSVAWRQAGEGILSAVGMAVSTTGTIRRYRAGLIERLSNALRPRHYL